ncbi:hypothetical protein B7R22_07675 [Subtercola boreus]|uniref:DUF559 domain-containing protein n=1 Tax=Subtercola boreus TaxID=120213 RepID=A0A3E0W0F3_9MICO|nr:DUF559 domain-containing protein [Subtercola boreus]RFA15003.1 hypothetical protein B7R22_07675 [Subtercola boreus]
MRRTDPSPERQDEHPFTVASALAAGVSTARLRRRDLEAPFRGVRRPGAAPTTAPRNPASERPPPSDRAADRDRREQARQRKLLSDARSFGVLLRSGEVFCGVTAALLWNAPLPEAFRCEDLHVGVRRPARSRRTSGTVGHTLAQNADISQRRFGLPVTDAASTWLSLAVLLPLNELVAVGDYFVHRPVFPERYGTPRPFVTLDELSARVQSYRGRGSVRARTAAVLLVTRAESRPESLLRFLLGEAGLPVPEVNGPVDDADGRIGRFDLVYRDREVIVEYDGDQHRTNDAQYELDMSRVERATLAGWQVIRVRKRGLFRDSAETTRRVSEALRRAHPRPRRSLERTQDATSTAR